MIIYSNIKNKIIKELNYTLFNYLNNCYEKLTKKELV